MAARRFAHYWRDGEGDIRFFLGPLWIRLIWGHTFRTTRWRWHQFHGHRLAAVRLRGERLAGIQWQRKANRHDVHGQEMQTP